MNTRGLSLIEVVVAMLVLTIGLLGLAAGTGWVLRSSEVARVDGARAMATQSAVELVRASPYAELSQGGTQDLGGGYSADWESLGANASGMSTQVRIIVTGPGRAGGAAGPGQGLGTAVSDTVDIWVSRP